MAMSEFHDHLRQDGTRLYSVLHSLACKADAVGALKPTRGDWIVWGNRPTQ